MCAEAPSACCGDRPLSPELWGECTRQQTGAQGGHTEEAAEMRQERQRGLQGQGCGRAALGTEWGQKLETVGRGAVPREEPMEGRRRGWIRPPEGLE